MQRDDTQSQRLARAHSSPSLVVVVDGSEDDYHFHRQLEALPSRLLLPCLKACSGWKARPPLLLLLLLQLLLLPPRGMLQRRQTRPSAAETATSVDCKEPSAQAGDEKRRCQPARKQQPGLSRNSFPLLLRGWFFSREKRRRLAEPSTRERNQARSGRFEPS